MATYIVTGVHRNALGRVNRGAMQRVNTATNQAEGPSVLMQAHEIANHLAVGDDVFAVFIVPGGTVLGPRFSQVVDLDGHEGVILSEDIEGRRLEDMVQIEY